MGRVDSYTKRESGVELLKIGAIFIIVLEHVLQTLCHQNTFIPYHDYAIDLSHATSNIQLLVLSMLRISGSLGNMIFFICSAWFLLEKKNKNTKKIFFMLTEIWFVSVSILLVSWLIMGGENIANSLVFKSFFPTICNNNWYMTCYIIFYAIHPALNKLIAGMNQRNLLKSAVVLCGMYVLINYVKHGPTFFYTNLMLWVAVYFMIAYMKFYLKDMSSSKKINLILLFVGIFGHFGLVALTNFMELRFGFPSGQLLYWDKNCSPFVILIAVSLLNFARGARWRSLMVNRISSLTLLIYIVHENIIIRTYARPLMWEWIYQNLGYQYILLWAVLCAVGIFVLTTLLSLLWQIFVQSHVRKISDKFYLLVRHLYNALEARMNVPSK